MTHSSFSKQNEACSTLIELLAIRARQTSSFPVYTYLRDGEEATQIVTFRELEDKSKVVAATLQQTSQAGERVMLLYPPGIEFASSYFGCLYSQRLAVPLPPPRPSRLKQTMERLLEIAKSAEPTVVLTVAAVRDKAEELSQELKDLQRFTWITTEDLPSSAASSWRPPVVSKDDIAFLQYTSGSTSLPKGVILTHDNLMHNVRYFDEGCRHGPDAKLLTWLPPFHDLGLIYGLLAPIYAGIRCYIMPNMAFVQQPGRWLQAISRYRITHTMAPNFAFDLCVESMSEEQVRSLDLSCWEHVSNGAEPVRMKTMDTFTQKFAPAGFRKSVFSPGWGLAEASCAVTISHYCGAHHCENRRPPREIFINAADLARHRITMCDRTDPQAVSLAGSGFPIADTDLRIVDPHTNEECPADQVGEIWVHNKSVGHGYWNDPAKSEETFHARIHGDPTGRSYLRTGDLGFFFEGEIFITGRSKDVIIIRGENHYPQDIEWSIRGAHPLVSTGTVAAVSVEAAGEERLVIISEVSRRFSVAEHAETVYATIRRVVADEHQVQTATIALVQYGSIAKTTSGKVQRAAAKDAFLQGRLTLKCQWVAKQVEEAFSPHPEHTRKSAPVQPEVFPECTDIANWLKQKVAVLSGLDLHHVDGNRPFGEFGLDSNHVVRLTGELEERFGVSSLPPTLMYDYPTIDKIADYIATQRKTTCRLSYNSSTVNEELAIAVVGMDCHFPGAADLDSFWRLLKTGASAIRALPEARRHLLIGFVPEPATLGDAGYLDDIELFDPAFFNISPKEAEHIDPQQRLLLMSVWRALENAGIPREELAGSNTGVFVGVSSQEYLHLALHSCAKVNGHIGPGTAHSIAANRISYFLDLHGPSVALDTACSSSLVAVHLARQSILAGECETAIVAGVNLLLHPGMSGVLQQAGMLSESAACHSFDQKADGYVRGEGVGVVILRRSDLAQQRDNELLALIPGSAVNQDGRSFGLTAPNGRAQQAVIRAALAEAHVSPSAIQYIEAHGTGTALGDPIEVSALVEVLKQGRPAETPCYLGAVKTNISHLEAAAGIAGLIKAVLCLQHGELPPLAGFTELNSRITLGENTLTINRFPVVFAAERPLTYVGVTSMGFGGTNAHVILRRITAPVQFQQAQKRSSYVLTLAADSEIRLQQLAADYLETVKKHPLLWPSICYRGSMSRSGFSLRRAVVARSADQLTQGLLALSTTGRTSDTSVQAASPTRQSLAFVFSGQGAQYPGMGKLLYAQAPLFRTAVDECDALLRTHHDLSVVGILYGERALDATALRRTDNAQITLFVVEYALTRYLQACGVHPTFVFGHSLGEYTAACIAGALSLEDTLTLLVARGRLMQTLSSEGAMLAAMCDEDTAAALCRDITKELSIAAVNGPQQVTVAGTPAAVEQFQMRCRTRSISTVALPSDRAFHSRMMERVLEAFHQVASTVTYQQPVIPIIGNITGKIVTEYSANYWVHHLRHTVRFYECVRSAQAAGATIMVEVGPQPILTSVLRRIGRDARSPFDVLPTLSQQEEEWGVLHATFAELYKRGTSILWQEVFRGEQFARVSLPNVRFDLSAYWLPIEEDKHMRTETRQYQNTHVNGSSPLPHPQATSLVDEVQMWIVQQLSELLKSAPEQLDAQRTFLELGADSLVLVELTRMLAEQYAIELSIHQLFTELNSVAVLSRFVAEQGTIAASTLVALKTFPSMTNDATNHGQTGALLPETPKSLVPHDAGTVTSTVDGSWQHLLEKQLDAFNQLVQGQLQILSGRTLMAPSPTVATNVLPPLNGHSVTAKASSSTLVPPSVASESFNDQQKQYLRTLVERYNRKTARSKQYAENYRRVFADYRSSMGFRAAIKEMLYPLVVDRAEGAHIWDIDGNEYVDLTMAFGASLFGYNPPLVIQALARQMDQGGLQVGPKCPLTGEVARLAADLTGMERVAFANSGTEAVMTAIRLARAVTGKTKIVRFTGSYHGHADTTLVKAGRDSAYGLPITLGVPAAVAQETIVLDYGTEESLQRVRQHLHEIAAIVVEPIQSRRPGLQPKSFLQGLRQLTQDAGCALIFDEIITGFRVAAGGAQEYFGVHADIATYGKVAGGGMPIGIIAGNRRFLNAIDGGVWSYGDPSTPQAVMTFFAGTFSGHPLTMAAAAAVLRQLKQEGPQLLAALNAKTDALVAELNRFFSGEAYPIHVDNAGSLFRFVFYDNFSVEFQPTVANLFFYNMILRGVYIWEGHTCFLSTAHQDEDCQRILDAAKSSAAALREEGFLSSHPTTTAQPLPAPPAEASLQKTSSEALNSLALSYIITGLQRLGISGHAGDVIDPVDAATRCGIASERRRLFARLFELLADAGALQKQGSRWQVVLDFEALHRTFTQIDTTPVAASVLGVLQRCGEQLPAVVQGHVTGAEVLFRGETRELLERLYVEAPYATLANKALQQKIVGIVEENRAQGQVHILEVGAGTGSATQAILRSLPADACHYIFTDLSSVFLHPAEKKFAQYSFVEYRTFDVEKNPLTQGFAAGSFDVIIASNVVHATHTVQKTLDHVQQLLKPNGALVLLECTTKQAWLDLIFGLTDGWWQFHDNDVRPTHPLLTASQWQTLLGQQGFSSVEIEPLGDSLSLIQASGTAAQITVPLSAAQREILVHLELGDHIAPAYNESVLFMLEGKVDYLTLERAFAHVGARHQSLRASVTPDDNGLCVTPQGELEIPVIDFSRIDAQLAVSKATEWVKTQSGVPFDVHQGPLVRCQLVKFAEERHWLLFVAHHLIIDGLSYGVLIEELFAHYRAWTEGTSLQVGKSLSFVEVSQRQRPAEDRSQQFWMEQLRRDIPSLQLPTDFPFPSQQTFTADRVSLHLPAELNARVKEFCKAQNVTPFMMLLAAYRLLLHRFCGQDASIIGIPVSVHPNTSTEAYIGFGVNLLPLVADTPPELSFEDYLQRDKRQFLQALEHRAYPFTDLIKVVNPERDPSRPPIITALFNFESIHALRTDRLTVTPVAPPTGYSKYELTMDVVADGNDIQAVLTYNTALFKMETAQALLERYRRLLQHLVTTPTISLGAIDVLLPDEREVMGINCSEPGDERCLHHLFEEQVVRTPQAVALRFHDQTLSYQDLNEHANRLAAVLMAWGVGRESRVAICLPRTSDLLIALLAVLKCGAAYAPLDPAYPTDRLQTLTDLADAAVLIVNTETASQERTGQSCRVLNLDDITFELAAASTRNPDTAVFPNNLAYLIFTSGSTGVPKAVAIEHRSAASLIRWAVSEFNPEQLRGTLASTSVCFDLSIFEIFLPLSQGHTVILVENILYLPELTKQDDITLLNTVPSTIEELVKMNAVPPSVRVINLAGEALQQGVVERIQQRYPHITVYNLYGPSEDTTYSTVLRIPADHHEPITIGRPIAGSQLYILDEQLNPTPHGTKGTIYVAGNGLCRGYLHNPTATASAFLPNPFAHQSGQRMYNTGDLGRLTANGAIEFLGRQDSQVKVRGHRIELGEIETVITAVAGVARAVVIADGEPGKQRLIGFYTCTNDAQTEELELRIRRHIGQKLPSYMAPSRYVRLNEFSLTPNRKVDRNRLIGLSQSQPVPETGSPKSSGQRDDLEREIAAIWGAHLNIEQVGPNDNFFELGGHSLLATQIVSSINTRYGCQVRLSDIIKRPTVSQLMDRVLEIQNGLLANGTPYTVAVANNATAEPLTVG